MCKASAKRSRNLASIEVKEMPSGKPEYEIFCDESYYGLWCVRSKDDRRFESPMSFHFMVKEDAETFKRLLEMAK
jgi:hypothetical protein